MPIVSRASFVLALMIAGCSAEHGAADATRATDAAIADARSDARSDAPIDATPDASVDLSCVNTPAPTVAADPLVVAGKVFAVVAYQVAPVADATVELRRRADDSLITTATTDSSGAFAITVTGGAPLDAWFAITTAGRLPTHAYPVAPLVGDEHALLVVADESELTAWYAASGATFTADARTVLTAIVDCDGGAAPDATITIAPAPATLTYYDAGAMRWDPQLAASTNGFALATATAASLTLTPQIGAVTLPARTITPAAGALTMVVAGPRGP